jgi:hypothetical protein
MSFNKSDLFDLLKLIRKSETKREGYELDEEDLENLELLAKNMIEMLMVEQDEDITLAKFRRAIYADETVLATFQLLGTGLRELMNYQGENKYTRTVKALKLVHEKFLVVVKSAKVLEAEVIKNDVSGVVKYNSIMRDQKKKNTRTSIIGGLNNRVSIHVARKSLLLPTLMKGSKKFLPEKMIKNLDKSQKSSQTNSPQSSKSSYNTPNKNKKTQGKNHKMSKFHLTPTIESHKKPSSSNVTSNISSPMHNIQDFKSQLSGKMSQIHNKRLDSLKEENIEESDLMAEFFGKSKKDESNIVFDKEDGIIHKGKLKKKIVPKFKNSNLLNLADIKRMVNEIEEGIYYPSDHDVLKNLKKNAMHRIQRKNRGKPESNMPTFRKIKRVPNPGSKIFEEFEKFLGSRREHKEVSTNEEDGNKEKGMKNLVDEILKSEQYQSSKGYKVKMSS